MNRADIENVKAESTPLRSSSNNNVRLLVTVGVLGVLGFFFIAFSHLLIVSVQSQPDCVPHTRADDPARTSYTAAKSSC